MEATNKPLFDIYDDSQIETVPDSDTVLPSNDPTFVESVGAHLRQGTFLGAIAGAIKRGSAAEYDLTLNASEIYTNQSKPPFDIKKALEGVPTRYHDRLKYSIGPAHFEENLQQTLREEEDLKIMQSEGFFTSLTAGFISFVPDFYFGAGKLPAAASKAIWGMKARPLAEAGATYIKRVGAAMVEGAVAGGVIGAEYGLLGAVEHPDYTLTDISTNVIQNALFGSILHGVVQKGSNVLSKYQKRGAPNVKNAEVVEDSSVSEELDDVIRGAIEGNEERVQFVGNAIYEVNRDGSISVKGSKELPFFVKQIYRSSPLGRGATSPFATMRSLSHSLLRSYTPLQQELSIEDLVPSMRSMIETESTVKPIFLRSDYKGLFDKYIRSGSRENENYETFNEKVRHAIWYNDIGEKKGDSEPDAVVSQAAKLLTENLCEAIRRSNDLDTLSIPIGDPVSLRYLTPEEAKLSFDEVLQRAISGKTDRRAIYGLSRRYNIPEMIKNKDEVIDLFKKGIIKEITEDRVWQIDKNIDEAKVKVTESSEFLTELQREKLAADLAQGDEQINARLFQERGSLDEQFQNSIENLNKENREYAESISSELEENKELLGKEFLEKWRGIMRGHGTQLKELHREIEKGELRQDTLIEKAEKLEQGLYAQLDQAQAMREEALGAITGKNDKLLAKNLRQNVRSLFRKHRYQSLELAKVFNKEKVKLAKQYYNSRSHEQANKLAESLYVKELTFNQRLYKLNENVQEKIDKVLNRQISKGVPQGGRADKSLEKELQLKMNSLIRKHNTNLKELEKEFEKGEVKLGEHYRRFTKLDDKLEGDLDKVISDYDNEVSKVEERASKEIAGKAAKTEERTAKVTASYEDKQLQLKDEISTRRSNLMDRIYHRYLDLLDRQFSELQEKIELLEAKRQQMKERTPFLKKFTEHEVQRRAEEQYYTIIGAGITKPSFSPHFSNHPSIGKMRTINVADDVMAKFLINDPLEIVVQTMRDLAPQNAMKQVFSRYKYSVTHRDHKTGEMITTDVPLKEWDDIRKILHAEYESLDNRPNVNREKLLESYKEAKALLETIVSLTMGTYPSTLQTHPRLERAMRDINNLAMIKHLKFVVFTTIMDSANILRTFGIKDLIGGYLHEACQSFKRALGNDLAARQKKDIARFGGAIEMEALRYFNVATYRFFDHTETPSWTDAAARSFIRYTGLNQATDFNKRVASTLYIDKLMEIVCNPSLIAEEESFIKETRLSPQLLSKIKDQFDKHGEIVDGHYILNYENWTDKETRDMLGASILSFSNNTIIIPDVGDVPLIFKTLPGRFLFRYMSFSYSFFNNTSTQIRSAKMDRFLPVALACVFFGGIARYLKGLAEGDPYESVTSKDFLSDVVVNLDLIGAFMWYLDKAGTVLKNAYKRGDEGFLRTVSREVAGLSYLADAVGTLDIVRKQFFSDGFPPPLSEKELRTMIGIIPIAAPVYVHGLSNRIIRAHTKRSGGKLRKTRKDRALEAKL
jgi:hypothetical protein